MNKDTPMSSEARIAELLRAGQLTAEDAQQLRSALPGTTRPTPLWRLVFSPWERLTGSVQLTLALALALVSILLGVLGGVRFDGTLDLHLAPGRVRWTSALADQLVAWLLSAAVFYLAARVVRTRVRLVDLALAVGAARLPLALGAVAILLIPLPRDPAAMLQASPVLLVALAILLLPLTIWFVALLYTGWRHATGLRAPRSGVTFAIALILAEVLSKAALSLVG
jgi:hypothetical protein